MLKQTFKLYLLLMTLLAAITSQAATITVANKNNSGAGSLRQAIIDANAGDIVIFDASLKGSILLASQIFVDKNLTINGPGANILGVEGRSTPPESRVFMVTAGTLRISDLRISRGSHAGAGGGVVVDGGNLTLNNCLITGNTAESAGGVVVFTGSTLTITNSTITGNVSAVEGGGVSNRGGTLTMINSTITGNEAPQGGGVSVDNGGTATILNCTITNNGVPSPETDDIGGLRISSGSVANLKNTIVAQNIGTPTAPTDIGGMVNSQGNNLIGNTTGGMGFILPPNSNADLLDINPVLGGFANNGGLTYTVSLLAGSPAINAGNNTGAPALDQRRVVRPQGGTVDIGSYESGVQPSAIGKITFVRAVTSLEIFSMDADGSNEIQLTDNTAFDSQPKFSPDGTRIVFISDRDGGLNEIYTMDSSNVSSPVRMTNNSIAEANPVWSPDGTKIAFDRNGQIFVMNATALATPTQVTSSSSPGVKAHPSWSPDGTQIAFHNNRGFGDVRVQVIPSTCGSCTSVQTLVDDLPDNFNPIWAPDGNTIAFSNDQVDFMNHSMPHTFLVSPWLNNLNFPTRPFGNQIVISQAWSPDGTKLVFQNAFNLLVIINSDGSSPTNLGVTGSLPHWHGLNTSSGTNITAVSGTTTVNFSSVSTSGTTTAVQINPVTGGPLPGGYSFGAGYPAYEITTTATYTAPITVCLVVPDTTPLTVFNTLVLFHGESGALVPRTSSKDFLTKTICASVMTLSPFVVAESLAPTSASFPISGRVTDANGRGIGKAFVSITNSNGSTQTALTNPFGNYLFGAIPAGATYVISVSRKGYQFSPRVITVTEELQGVDFSAEP